MITNPDGTPSLTRHINAMTWLIVLTHVVLYYIFSMGNAMDGSTMLALLGASSAAHVVRSKIQQADK